jgi:tRNA pseudouridine synthase 10
MKLVKRAIELLKLGYVCDHCLGRVLAAQLLSGLTNEQRGSAIRKFMALMIDSGHELGINPSNLAGIELRQVRVEAKRDACIICGDVFREMDMHVKRLVKELRGIEFDTFLIGCVPKDEWLKQEERAWEVVGIEFCESIRSELNRELGRRISELMGKEVDFRLPDVTLVMDFKRGRVRRQLRSLFVFGEYKKLRRGIPQCKWICRVCKGRGCPHCDGRGKLYRTSVQELIERPLLRAAGSKASKFSGMGREDVNVRCLGWRPFVIELLNPLRRRLDLRKACRAINSSKVIKVRRLKFVDRTMVRKVKSFMADKAYEAFVTFEGDIEPNKLRRLMELKGSMISQRTPLRVIHRRADKLRRRVIKELRARLLGRKKLWLRLRVQAGFYVKEFIDGDYGRTSPSVAELLENRPRRIELDVVRIYHDLS